MMNRNDQNKLTVATYNSQHFKGASHRYVKDILAQCDILFMQEHCLYLSQLDNLYGLGDINYHGTSQMDEAAPLIGRPYGGCVILWHGIPKSWCKLYTHYEYVFMIDYVAYHSTVM